MNILCHVGGKILLNNARLVLKRGRRYGLCGANGAGKSTLMKAIAAGKVDGFPPADKLLTVYVEHDIQASLEELTVRICWGKRHISVQLLQCSGRL